MSTVTPVLGTHPRTRLLPELQPHAPASSAPSSAGLIVITGPPMSGKAALGHYVNEYLPDSVHVSQTDPVVADLQNEDPEPLNALLHTIRSQLRCGRKVVFSGRLDSAKQRRRVLDVAQEVGAPKLLVEVEGTDPEALARASKIAATLDQIQEMLLELKELLPEYCAVTDREQRRVSTITVPAEEPVEEQVKAVLDGWGQLGAIS